MYELIRKNKRRSGVLIFLFSGLVLALGWLFSYVYQDGYFIFVIALIFNMISILVGYYKGDSLVLASVKAKEIKKEADPELYRIVENLAITSGIPTPKVYLIPDTSLNAFATGRDPEHASVAITIGLRKLLNKQELEAVMGHELSHIKNYDIRVALLASMLFGMVVFMADLFFRAGLGGGRDRKKGGGPLLILAIIAMILAPLGAQMIKFAISRRREFLADADSVMLTRYPEAMVSALQKIAQEPTIEGSHKAIAHLFIYPPSKKSSFKKLFSTHPPINERIDAIRKAARL